MICPYCGKHARFVDNSLIYGKRYGASYMMWWCKPCDALVGTHHNNPNKPLGTLANKDLRTWRRIAHRNFDLLWKTQIMTRKQAYRRLSRRMHIGKEIHIGESDIEQCKKIVSLIQSGNLKSGFYGYSMPIN